jgi:hypothetical protein
VGDRDTEAATDPWPLPPHAELLLVGTHEQRQRFGREFG